MLDGHMYPDQICPFCNNDRSVRVGPPENDHEPSN